MVIYLVLLCVILFITFCMIWEKDICKSLFFTAFFLIALWVNVPCFVSGVYLPDSDNLLILPFKLFRELKFIYILVANLLLSIVLYLQARFTNKVTYTYNEIKRRYDAFGEDAVELYVIGKDLDFLGKNKFRKQTERIKHLGSKSTLLCESTNDRDLLLLYKEVYKQGVKIKFYKHGDSITNLKGQIKLDQSGHKKAIFMSKTSRNYILLNIENQFLVASILEKFTEIYKKGDAVPWN